MSLHPLAKLKDGIEYVKQYNEHDSRYPRGKIDSIYELELSGIPSVVDIPIIRYRWFHQVTVLQDSIESQDKDGSNDGVFEPGQRTEEKDFNSIPHTRSRLKGRNPPVIFHADDEYLNEHEGEERGYQVSVREP